MNFYRSNVRLKKKRNTLVIISTKVDHRNSNKYKQLNSKQKSTVKMHQSVIRIGPAPLQTQQTSVIYKVATQSIPQDYSPPAPPIKSSPVVTTTVNNTYPVMDATVASSVKGEPELNIGKIYIVVLRTK